MRNLRILLCLILVFNSVIGFSQSDPFDNSTNKSYEELLILFAAEKATPSDDSETFLVLDSIVTSNIKADLKNRISAFSFIAGKSDGALSEVMGIYSLDYIKNKPKEFLALLARNKSDELFEKSILNFCAFELYASEAEDKLTEQYDAIVNAEDLKNSEKEELLDFLKKIEATYIELE